MLTAKMTHCKKKRKKKKKGKKLGAEVTVMTAQRGLMEDNVLFHQRSSSGRSFVSAEGEETKGSSSFFPLAVSLCCYYRTLN